MKLKKLRAPPLSDARYLQAAILILYAFAAREFFNFERPHFAAVICVAWAVALDLLIGKFYFKRLLFPLSAVIVGLSASILIDAQHWFYFLIVVTLAILSKAFITYRGKHFFNPTNFGVVLVIQLLPGQVAAIPHLFSGFLWPSVVFALLGILTVFVARQSAVSFSWVLGFMAFALYRASRAGSNVWVAFGPLLSSSFLLFTFHMISDPGTTPRTWRMQIAFGLMAAILDGLLRVYQVPHGQFYALFIASATLCWFRDYEERQ